MFVTLTPSWGYRSSRSRCSRSRKPMSRSCSSAASARKSSSLAIALTPRWYVAAILALWCADAAHDGLRGAERPLTNSDLTLHVAWYG